jgi:hypothetical protein
MKTTSIIRNPFAARTLLPSLLGSALALVAAFSVSTAHAVVNAVTVNIGGQVIKSGSQPKAYSTTPIDPATVYKYTITGNVVGTGQLQSLISSPISISAALSLLNIDPSILTGRVYNPGAKFPFTVVNINKPLKKFKQGPVSGTGSVVIQAGITGASFTDSTDNISGAGYCGFSTKLLNFTLTLILPPPFPPQHIKVSPDTGIVFQSGAQIYVEQDTTADPDLSLILPTGKVIGKNITGGIAKLPKLAKGKSITLPVTLKNNGSLDTVFSLAVTDLPPGFTQTVTIKGESTPLTLATDLPTIPSLKSTKLIWKITNVSADSGATGSVTLSATANSVSDTLEADLTAK